ncbi:7-deoxyloganetin glucosyltransferase-like protein [Cinnamomum micranthum f. kanehirae]|uniref:Glycosyltransferase n=1 Tax=Cinnamomum micranthum f. kanehirae TaxID=337451 RepID=A0A443PAJ0_9MAGN|nr:7-deoxyloganetin glucosyltransferase-like protein [Cinnamomum micranthum f. kanehirae]
MEEMKRPHVVCIPFPAQGHINPMMQLAKLLHSRGFSITFVNTDFSHKLLLKSRGLDSLEDLDGFRFEVISDGLSPSFGRAEEDGKGFCKSVKENCVAPFCDLLKKLHHPLDGHRVTCVISDSFMTFTLKVAEELGIPEVIFCPTAACGFMAFAQYHELMRRGLAPLKDESCIRNGYLDTTIDWIPGMRDIRLRDLGSFLQTTDPNNFLLNFIADEAQKSSTASAIIFNTFDYLEHEILHAIRSIIPPCIYAIGPLSLQCRLLPDNVLKSARLSMWKEETECLKWLDGHEAASVIYVNFGSTTVLTENQLMEFALGIAHSKYPFLWVIRPNLVMGGHTNLPQELMDEIEGRGMLVGWCPQEKVLAHPSIAVFLTHCGWNSTLESISFGVPMLCWPFLAEQQTNCRYSCHEWGVGMEINNNAKGEEIEALLKEMMGEEKGKEIRKNALKFKESAEDSVKAGGSSHTNLELLIQELLRPRDFSN